MDDLTLINNTSVYRNPAPQSPLQGPNVMQPAAVYSKIMLRTIELAESDYVFDSIATERTMPSNNGSNEIVFKRMLSLAAHTQPLVEGIPPASDKGAMVAIKGSTKSYGRVMKFTDKVNWAVVDPLISEYTRQLSLKIPETKDILAQEALLAECQVFYAQPKKVYSGASDPDTLVLDSTKPMVSHITKLNPDCNPTLDEFRKIVLSMEAAKVRPGAGGNFKVLASSAVLFDLITDHRVKEFMKFSNTGEAYKNDMVIDLFSLAFQKAKTIKTDNTYIDADGVVKYLYHVPSASISTSVDSALSATYAGRVNLILPKALGDMTSSDTYIVVYLDAVGTPAAVPANKTLTNASSAALGTLFGAATGIDVLNIHHSYVIGEEALFRIGVEGHTAPQFIKKELGSAGTEDPLNQRQSIGWKIDSLGYKVVNPDAVVDYMSIPSQYRINVNARPDLKNQFTDYYYGYVDPLTGNYYHPEQVVEFGGVYKVRGTNVTVNPIKMTELVKPVNGGRIDANGLKNVVKGDAPTMQYALASNKAIRFLKDQVVEGGHASDKGHFYIKGFEGNATTRATSAAEVVAIEPNGVVFSSEEYKADGTGKESRTALVEHGDVNKTGDGRID
jgi:N4-gp56 family major capsid protein